MNFTSHLRTKELFHSALEREPNQREAFLQEACGGDRTILADVQTLLAAYESASKSFDQPFVDKVEWTRRQQAIFEGDASEVSGTCLGAYRLIKPIGRGGTGIVWLAERADGQFERRAAIKLIQNVGTAEMRRRFQTERQTLASLDHPYIARLFDGGTTDSGTPYLVMEYVEGRRIDRYCDELKMPITERISLLLKVCEAVEYAHRNLIVHRDLKPDNIHVDTDGRPRLLDFGIAKLLNLAGDREVDTTLTALRVFTPEYASPEQFRGESVTTASDVYSLGAVFYELLTGHRVREFDSSATVNWSTFADIEPEKPSHIMFREKEIVTREENGHGRITPHSVAAARGVSVDRLRRILTGDLDMIALKALRSEPERRYGSVEQFAEDLQRHIRSLPIRARSDGWTYRASRFVRRNRALVVGVTASVLGLAATTIGTSVGFLQARDAKKQAERQLALTQATNYFLVEDLLGAASPKKGLRRDITVREIVDLTAEKIDQRIPNDPAIRGSLHEIVGQVYLGVGEQEKAAKHLEKSLELRSQHYGDDCKTTLGCINDLAEAFRSQGRFAEAEALHLKALNSRRRIRGEEHPETLNSMQNLAAVYHQQGRMKEAEALLTQVLERRQRIQPDENEAIMVCRNNLGVVYLTLGRYEQAESVFEQVLGIYRKTLGDQNPQMARCEGNLAVVFGKQGKFELADPLIQKALQTQQQVLGHNHPATLKTLRNQSELYHDQSRFSEAEALHATTVESYRRTLGDKHPDSVDAIDLLAQIYYKLGRNEEADPLCRSAVSNAREALSDQHWRTGVYLCTYGSVLSRIGHFTDAETALLESHSILHAALGPSHEQTIRTARALMAHYEVCGKSDLASTYRNVLPELHP